jgi:hypothetical protein
MSFLTGVFQAALDGDISLFSEPEKVSYAIHPGQLLRPVYVPATSAMFSSTSARDGTRRFPLEMLDAVDSVDNSDSSGMCLVRKLGPTSFVVRKHSTGREFNVRLGPHRSCSCPECDVSSVAKSSGTTTTLSANKTCAVVLFVLLKVLQIPRTSPLFFRKSWTATETDAVIAASFAQKAKIVSQNIRKPYTGKTFKPHKRGEDDTMYEDEFSDLYGYNDVYTPGDLSALGGAYRLSNVQDPRQKTFTVRQMRDLALANVASVQFSRGDHTRSLDGVSVMDSLDAMMPPPDRPEYSTTRRAPQLQSNGMVLPADSALEVSLPSLSFDDQLDFFPDSPQTHSPPETGRTETTLASTSTDNDLTVDYPFFISGGRKVIAAGCVLPAGTNIRHPSMLFASKFRHAIKEFLYVWDTTKDRASKDMLSVKIRGLWVMNSTFKQWAASVHARNVRKVHLLKKARIRVTVVMQNGTATDVCVSPLVTGDEVTALALKKRRMVSKSVNRRGKDMRLVFQNEIVDSRRTLYDAKVSERSTLRLVHPLAITTRGEGYL